MFWINLPRYVAVILYGSIYRTRLPSCEPYKWILSSSNCGNLCQAKHRNGTISSTVPTPLFSTLTGLSRFFVPHLHFTQNWAWQTQSFYSKSESRRTVTDRLGNARKEYHGKSFEGRQCSRFLSCIAFLKEVVPSSVYWLVECFEVLHHVVIGVFGQILDPGFENDITTFEETSMKAMRTHNPRMAPKVHVLVHYVPGYVRRTGVQLGPTRLQITRFPRIFPRFDFFTQYTGIVRFSAF